MNGVRLHYALEGTGDPMVFIHGSWGDHASWGAVAPAFANAFRVLRYDRRGHSQSERPAGQGSVHDDVADAAALLEHLGLAPAHVVGNSYGSCIALRLAAVRPDVVRSVAAHEPPFFGVLRESPQGDAAEADMRTVAAPVLRLIEEGRHADAAERFVEDLALGPGTWPTLPPALQRIMTYNAPTWLDEYRDPHALSVAAPEALSLERVEASVLLSNGDRSPPFYVQILEQVASRLPDAARHTYTGAGHIPHITHAEAFVERVTQFAHRTAKSAKAAEQAVPPDAASRRG